MEDNAPLAQVEPGMPDPNDNHLRAHLRMMSRAITEQWDIPIEVRKNLVAKLVALTEGFTDDERVIIGAARVIQAMARDNLDAYIAADKIVRLEEGLATENIRIEQIIL